MTTQQLMQTAVELHQQGDLLEASRIYHRVLSEDATNADAWNLAGVVASQVGQTGDAITSLRQAISLQPTVAFYHLNLASALMDAGELTEAARACQKCLELDPQNAEACNTLGNVLQKLGCPDEAATCFQQALALQPGFASAYCNAGVLNMSLGRLAAAEDQLLSAIECDPHLFQACTNLGSLYRIMNRFADAEHWFRRALERNPDVASVHVSFGNLLTQQGRFEEAASSFESALQLDPESANAWNSLADFQQECGQHSEALDSLKQALELSPTSETINSNYLFALNLCTQTDRQTCFEQHVQWGRKLVNKHECSPQFTNDRSTDRRLRVGYVSPDFRQHALVSFFEPLLRSHDREAFEITCLAEVAHPDETTARLQSISDHWVSTCGRSAASVTQQARELQLDILVDLAGHTAGNRLDLFAHRAAPVQASMLGYLNTTGLATVDYYVTDAVRDPAGSDPFYTETLVRLASGGNTWQPPETAPEITPPPCLENGWATFGSTHRLNKLTSETIDLWSQVLHRVPDSVLLIFRDSLVEGSAIREHVLGRFARRGIAPERIRLEASCPGGYLDIFRQIDVLLDAVPWGAGTTLYESLWMGVPMPTIAGSRPVARAALSPLTRLGLQDWIAGDRETYVEIVAGMSSDRAQLARLRQTLRERMRNSVCDAATFVSEFESALQNMWLNWCGSVQTD